MRRWWFLMIPMVVMMTAVMLPIGHADRFAVDPDAPWMVEDSVPFYPSEWAPEERPLVESVSPKGGWLYGRDQLEAEQRQCYWETSTWRRTCPQLEPGEAISFTRASAWSPDDTTLVAPTFRLVDERRYAERLVRIELATGNLTELYRPEQDSYIAQIAFSPASSQIAFIEMAGDAPITIWRIDGDGGGPETILTASDAVTLSDAADLRWTAADQIVFFSGPYASDTQGYFRVNSDGSDLERITAVTPADLDTRIRDISADGRFMIAEGMDETEACGADYFKASSYVVDLERDEIVQVVCAVYQPGMPDARGASLFAATRAVVVSRPAFLPDGSILVLAEQRAGGRSAAGLAVIDVASGRFSIVSNDLPGEASLWGVSSGLDDGAVRVWMGGYWRDMVTLTPRTS